MRIGESNPVLLGYEPSVIYISVSLNRNNLFNIFFKIYTKITYFLINIFGGCRVSLKYLAYKINNKTN